MFDDWDGILVKDHRRKKVNRLRRLSRYLELDGIGGSEVRLNGARSKVVEKIGNLLTSKRTGIVAHVLNTNKNIGLGQERVTFMAVFEKLAKYQASIDHNPYGLRRWTSLQL